MGRRTPIKVVSSDSKLSRVMIIGGDGSPEARRESIRSALRHQANGVPVTLVDRRTITTFSPGGDTKIEGRK